MEQQYPGRHLALPTSGPHRPFGSVPPGAIVVATAAGGGSAMVGAGDGAGPAWHCPKPAWHPAPQYWVCPHTRHISMIALQSPKRCRPPPCIHSTLPPPPPWTSVATHTTTTTGAPDAPYREQHWSAGHALPLPCDPHRDGGAGVGAGVGASASAAAAMLLPGQVPNPGRQFEQ